MEPIDVVYTWVDGLDSGLISSGNDIAFNRYRDNGELRYSLRSLEEYAPWTRKIYLVTNGQFPAWLKDDPCKVIKIDHRSIFPLENSLPTYNSNAIELCLHRIPGLSRRFLYMNDDVFFGRLSSRDDFITSSDCIRFYQENLLIKDEKGPDSDLRKSYRYTMNLVENLWKIEGQKYLPAHTPQLYDRDILEYLEQIFPDDFRRTINNRFRSGDDLVLRILFYYYLIGSSIKKKRGEAKLIDWGSSDYSFWTLRENFFKSAKAFLHLMKIRPRFFCINDDVSGNSFINPVFYIFRNFLRLYFPNKSSFEK